MLLMTGYDMFTGHVSPSVVINTVTFKIEDLHMEMSLVSAVIFLCYSAPTKSLWYSLH